MRVCEWFDRYRDGELSAAEQAQFKAHMQGCADCRERKTLLDNLVCALKKETAEASLGFAERTARRAFEQRKSWESLVISWLRPAQVLAALVVMFLVFSSLWLLHSSRQAESVNYGEYEALVNESYGLSPSGSAGQVHSDDELLGWIEQEGGAR